LPAPWPAVWAGWHQARVQESNFKGTKECRKNKLPQSGEAKGMAR